MALEAAAPVPHGPRFDAGRVCLDLLATAHPAERLYAVEPLRAWIAGSGLVPTGTRLGHADGSWPPRFWELRTHIEQLVRWTREGAPSRGPALDRVNDVARAAAPPAPRAVLGADGLLVRESATAPACAELLAAVARDAVELLTDPVARAAVRQCEGDTCPLVYLDTSRGHRRRWCSSEACGNRARVARHRRRTAPARA